MKQLFRIALSGVVVGGWLVGEVVAQVIPSERFQRTPFAATGPVSFVRKTQRTVDSLQRMTQPGYYATRFAAKSPLSPSARIAAAGHELYLCKGATPTNTAPVATINATQSVQVNTLFSYTINAFTDAETPNSLTYTVQFDHANIGLTFDPRTRVVSGRANNANPVSVTVTATDPGNLSASTTFTIANQAVAASEPTADLAVRVLGNPVVGSHAQIEIRGAEGQAVVLTLVDLQGTAIHEQRIEQAGNVEPVSISLGSNRGLLLLNVNTVSQRQQVKLVRP